MTNLERIIEDYRREIDDLEKDGYINLAKFKKEKLKFFKWLASDVIDVKPRHITVHQERVSADWWRDSDGYSETILYVKVQLEAPLSYRDREDGKTKVIAGFEKNQNIVVLITPAFEEPE